MTAKRYLFVFVLGALLVGGGGYLCVTYFPALKPVVLPPPEDITTLLKDSNTTNFPLQLPPGFAISIYAKDLGKPRELTFGPSGLLVSVPSEGKILSLKDVDGDGVAETVTAIASNLDTPNGLATRCIGPCKLYVAERTAVSVFDFDEAGNAINRQVLFSLPPGGRHTTRSLLFLPGEKDQLLVSVGSSCDVCHEQDPRYASILLSHLDGKEPTIYASGLRNTVFMELQPVSGEVWGADMGRDNLGDDTPPDEINIIQQGKNYGWPICYGKNIHDTSFDKNTYIQDPCSANQTVPSYRDIPAHSAPLGLSFIPEEGWPEDYWYNLLVAYHGSWNRTEPTGYKIERFKLDANGNYLGQEDFITGWLTKDGALGRPVDILTLPGGTIYISDDKAGVVYKVRRTVQLN
ncbi:oxidoreductase [Candidatus Uhrbacteria bacterium CG10_big_fil_rev_8_21_14_0_10_48_11]|uniref:Oxidoreductase n=1 Tax=Candidatus Uhrbacteria bacterium CG10_big_fil_rev_8_21_14_0_10_48_11 TaxID=1975037 RepID=A0A2M8LEU9_9BACT|nr:MAG: oxidoreductase [Candidatus Uhrbacteria bacterium CG10_big_fil_rev_8_21_14_0_10_48_11]